MALNPKIAPMCFILAPSYHGVTTLSARANLHPDILSLGNGNPLQHEEQICSCGEDVHEFCPFWTKAAEAIEKDENDPLPNLLPHSPYIASNKTLNKWINSVLALIANEIGPKTWKMFYEPAERFYGIHDRFLSFCQEWTPHKIFFDAERSVLKFMAMASMGFPVKGVIHIVRDPRGYAAAWKRYYPETTAEKLGMEWAASHTRIRRLAHAFPKVPFMIVKYEDLMEQPVQTYEKVLKFMKLEVFAESEMALDPRKNHLLGLQSIDHVAGMVPKADNWRESLHPEDQDRVVKAAGSLFAELGYKS
jgi:hypothetical protein